MEKEEEVQRFIAAKGEVLENFEALEVRLGACEDQGHVDAENELYYEVTDLIEASNSASNFEQLISIIYKGKELERSVDAFLADRGYSTMSLEWPEV